jgi:hypothetical protein
MSRRSIVLVAALLATRLSLADGPAVEPVIFGEYLEARSDVHHATFVPITGISDLDLETPTLRPGRGRPFEHRAVLGWNITHGTWNGEELDGLSIVAIVESQGSLGTPIEGQLRTLVLIDVKATKKQKDALLYLFREFAPRFARRVKKVRSVKFRFQRGDHDLLLEAEKTLSLRVKLHEHTGVECESICGKDPQPQKPLCLHVQGERAVATKDLYSGSDLPVRWSAKDSGRTLAGRFSL